MKALDIWPSMPYRVPFRLSETVRVPEMSGCYVLANVDEDVLYIGRSGNMNQRMDQHLNDPRMTEETPLGLAVWFYCGSVPLNQIEAFEESLLFQYKAVEGRLPPLNRIGP